MKALRLRVKICSAYKQSSVVELSKVKGKRSCFRHLEVSSQFLWFWWISTTLNNSFHRCFKVIKIFQEWVKKVWRKLWKSLSSGQNEVSTDSLNVPSFTSAVQDFSFDRMTLKPGLDVYTFRLESRMWTRWNPLGISFSGSRRPNGSSSVKVSPHRYLANTRITSSSGA